MSRSRHPRWRLRRYILSDGHYDEHLSRIYAADPRQLERDLDEYDDVPDGDYVTSTPLHEAEAQGIHHRGRRRDAQVRRRERWLRDSKRAHNLIRDAAGLTRKVNPFVGRTFTNVDELLAYVSDLNNPIPDFESDHDDCKKG